MNYRDLEMDISLRSHFLLDDSTVQHNNNNPSNNNNKKKKKDSKRRFHSHGNQFDFGIALFGGSNNNDTKKKNYVTNPMAQECLSNGVEDPETMESLSDSTMTRRNLTEAFDEIYSDNNEATSVTPTSKLVEHEQISPTGVMDMTPCANDVEESELPHFDLHVDLKRDLSQHLVNRVAIYGVLHDINKEALSMDSNDHSSFHRVHSMDEDEDTFSPIVMAVNGTPLRAPSRGSVVESSLIDEEQWLLSVIQARGDDECQSMASCPPTFSQAMGERDYDETFSTMEASRTQLWKPSRSWWEAKSGKNPWIEPKSHNKRWR